MMRSLSEESSSEEQCEIIQQPMASSMPKKEQKNPSAHCFAIFYPTPKEEVDLLSEHYLLHSLFQKHSTYELQDNLIMSPHETTAPNNLSMSTNKTSPEVNHPLLKHLTRWTVAFSLPRAKLVETIRLANTKSISHFFTTSNAIFADLKTLKDNVVAIYVDTRSASDQPWERKETRPPASLMENNPKDQCCVIL